MAITKMLARDVNAHKILFDPSDDRPIYIGINQEFYATTTSDSWDIYKFTYDTTTSSNTTIIDRTRGIWNNRATTVFP